MTRRELLVVVHCQSLKLGFTVMKLGFTDLKLRFTVIPAQAGIQIAALVSRLRGNDVTQKLRFDKAIVRRILFVKQNSRQLRRFG